MKKLHESAGNGRNVFRHRMLLIVGALLLTAGVAVWAYGHSWIGIASICIAALIAARTPMLWILRLKAERGAQRGNAEAQFMLGTAYEYGHGVKQDGVEAVRWYRMAAEQGHPDAQFVLGGNYLLGERLVAKDPSEGIRWCRKAAEQGHRSAQVLLGKLYANSEFPPNDTQEALRWFSAAFNASSLTQSIAKEHAEDLRWFLSAAHTGDSEVMLNVANIYGSSGRGVKQDYKEALHWYLMAADKGNEEAMCFLGHMYETAKGTSQDFGEAMRWYRLAAEKGNVGAMFNIGIMCTRGQGVSIDARELYFWFYLCSTYPSLPQLQANHVKKACEVLKTKLAPESMTEIRERAQRWIETHPTIHLRTN